MLPVKCRHFVFLAVDNALKKLIKTVNTLMFSVVCVLAETIGFIVGWMKHKISCFNIDNTTWSNKSLIKV